MKLKEKKEELSKQTSSASTSSSSSSSKDPPPLNFDFAATLAQVRAKAAASLIGATPSVQSISSEEMRERERQRQEQKEVYIFGIVGFVHRCVFIPVPDSAFVKINLSS